MKESFPMLRNVSKYVIGIDEGGRGPLAGPGAGGGVKITVKRKTKSEKLWEIFSGIKDSKQLTEKQREEWFSFLTSHPQLRCAVAFVWPRMIDRINIRNATLIGAQKVYDKLSTDGACPALLDGGLFLSDGIEQETIIKGDEKIPLIAAASIIAKVRRDRLMRRLHRKYPQYRFDLHKGYGTKLHRMLIAHHGASPVHRMSFKWREI